MIMRMHCIVQYVQRIFHKRQEQQTIGVLFHSQNTLKTGLAIVPRT